MSGLKKAAKKILHSILKIIPRSKKIWVFGAWQGKMYADNSKYLFEYIQNNKKGNDKNKYIWLTKNKKVVKHLNDMGYICYHEKSIKGMWYALRAGVAFETEGSQDISFLLDNKRTQIIQLWHGMGTKSMQWAKDEKKKEETFKNRQKRGRTYHWMATSQLYVDTFIELMGLSNDNFTITGYPRNDTFVTKPKNEYVENLIASHPDSKFIVYMPTHRNFGRSGNDLINEEKLLYADKKLKEKNIYMVYKPHIHELANFLHLEDKFTNIILAKDSEIWADVYSYLHYFDLLISDYSSVITDFMCSGKPVVLFPYDIENYKTADAGLNEYFWRIPGGPMCYNWDELIETTDSLLKNDTWKEEREKARVEYHLYSDGKNSQRVYNAVIDIINNKNKRK